MAPAEHRRHNQAMQPAHHAHPSSRLTPAMRQVLDRMARVRRLPLQMMTAQQAREAYAAGADVLERPTPPQPREDTLGIPTRDGSVLHARLYAPATGTGGHTQQPVLLYFHGGGFTIGSVATHQNLCRRLSQLAHCAVVSVDYRLAPEHRFPVAAHDAFDSLAWLQSGAHTLGLDACRMAVGGDSAGGTLAAATALHARDQGWPLVLQLLFYPGCVDHPPVPSRTTYAQGFALEQAHIDYFYGHYLGQGDASGVTASADWANRGDWRFSPLLADDHAGVAPAWFGLAECDPLVDEGIAYADVLRAAGVAVDLEIYAGVVHEFIKMDRAIPEAAQAHAHAAQALRRAFRLE
jgi:acetyl esterase